MSHLDFSEMDMRNVEWLYGRLIEQKRKEKEVTKQEGKRGVKWHRDLQS